MHKTNRQLVVYLSKSLKVEEKKLQEVRDQLTSCGFLINEYKGGEYDSELRSSADFVLVVPFLPTLESSPRVYWTNVGKGQYSEVCSACIEDQPTFIYMGYEDGEILMTKCKEDIDDHWLQNSNDWKLNYGTITSYVMANEPVPLYEFITGYMEHSKLIKHRNYNKEYPLTYNEAFKNKVHLLLLK